MRCVRAVLSKVCSRVVVPSNRSAPERIHRGGRMLRWGCQADDLCAIAEVGRPMARLRCARNARMAHGLFFEP